MELSAETFLDSVANPHTKKEYRYGIKKFCEWYGKSAEEILKMRQDDLTSKEGESLVERRFRAARFQRKIEIFHSSIIEQGKSINTARTSTIGIRQLFRFYQMPVVMRSGSRISKTVKTTKSFPLRIEHVRTMFKVADLRERVMLSMATDLALRISDFIKLKKEDLPILDQEPPIPFEIMTNKEDVIAYGFLSAETVELLKSYMVHLDQREQNRRSRAERENRKHRKNPYLFPSNSTRHISGERVNALLKILAEKSKINTNTKRLTFHCFRKMFLSVSIDSGIGLTAGKKLIGKAIPQSDDTYLTTVQLHEKFIQLKKYLTIQQTIQPENHERFEELSKAVLKLQEDVNAYKTIAETITEKDQNLEEQIAEMQKLDNDTVKEIEKLKQVYQQGLQELEMELKKERARLSNLSKIIQPLIKRQMKKLGQKVGKEMKQMQTERKRTG